jgi:Uma2 family endonuclease
MGILQRKPGRYALTADEFYAFTESRPDGEKWELIGGKPVMSPSANRIHQKIVGNLIVALVFGARESAAKWEAIPGIGAIVSETSIPVPDVLVRPATLLKDWKCDDLIVAFEVLSPSTADHDLRWKRKAYPELASLQHYVVVAQDAAEVTIYDRASGFAERRVEGLAATLDLPALGISIPLKEIYHDTGIEE